MTRTLAVLAIVISLMLVACGGDDDSSVTDDTSTEIMPTEDLDSDAESNDSDSTAADGDDDGASAGFHACSLFTGAEMSEILGVEMNDGRDYLATAAGATNCTWEGEAVIFIEVLLEDGQDWYDAIHLPGVGGQDSEPVEGIGDEATWDSFVNVLDVVDDDRFISVQTIGGLNGTDDKEAALEVARLTLERLP